MSAAGVETRAAKVALASGLSTALTIVLQIVSVPVCLRFWGEQTYGLWLALLALANVVRTLETGFNVYVGNELNLLYHTDPDALRKKLSSALWGALVVGVISLLAAALIVASGGLAGLLGVSDSQVREARAGLAFAVMLVGFVSVGPYIGVVHRLMIPAGLLHQSTWLFMAFQITQTAALVVAAALRFDLPAAALLVVLAHIALYLVSAAYVARKLPAFFPWWKRPSWAIGMRDLLRSGVIVGANLLAQAGTNGAVMVVASGLGAAAVPAFTTARTLANLWTSLGNALLSPLLPEVVRYHAHRDATRLVAAFEAHWLIANVAVNLTILACLPFVDDAYRLWTGGEVTLEPALLYSLLLSVVVGTAGSLIMLYLNAINDLRAVTWLYAVRGLVPLGVGLALLPWLGLVGVGIGVVLGELLGPVVVGSFYLRHQLRRLDARVRPRWQPAALGASFAAVQLVLQAAQVPHVAVFHGAALVGVLGSAFWGWREIHPEVRERVLRLVRR